MDDAWGRPPQRAGVADVSHHADLPQHAATPHPTPHQQAAVLPCRPAGLPTHLPEQRVAERLGRPAAALPPLAGLLLLLLVRQRQPVQRAHAGLGEDLAVVQQRAHKAPRGQLRRAAGRGWAGEGKQGG